MLTPDQLDAKAIAQALSHDGAAECARRRVVAPDTEAIGVTIVGDLRIVVSITRYDGPGMPLTPAEIAAIQAVEPAVRTPMPGRPDAPALTDLQRRIVAVCDGKPKKASVIAARLGVACSGSFRGTLAMLVRFGVLTWDDGYKRPDART